VEHPGTGLDPARAAMYGAMGPQQVRDAVQAEELSKADAFDIIHGNKAPAVQAGGQSGSWTSPGGIGAMLFGVSKGSAKTAAGIAAAETAEPANVLISELTGPFAPATFGLLNVVEFLAGSYLTGRTMDAVSDAASGVPEVAQLRKDVAANPLQAQTGEMLPALVAGGASLKNLAGKAVSEGLGPVVKQVLGGATAGAVTEMARPYVEAAVEKTLGQLGVRPQEVQPATLRSIVESSAWGALLSGVGGRDASEEAVRQAPPEVLKMAQSSPELRALHPEMEERIGGVENPEPGTMQTPPESDSPSKTDSWNASGVSKPESPQELDFMKPKPAQTGTEADANDQGPVTFRDLIYQSATHPETRDALKSNTHPGIGQEFLDHLKLRGLDNEKSWTRRIAIEQPLLLDWASKNGLLLPPDVFDHLPLVSNNTAEHAVWRDPATGRAVKFTTPGDFGIGLEKVGNQLYYPEASPSDYLRRWQLFNEAFDSDVRVEGFIEGKHDPATGSHRIGMVISQPWIKAQNPLKPNPTEMQIERFMKSFGFLQGKAECEWFRPSDGMYVADAHPENFISTEKGIAPIDFVMKKFSQDELKQLELQP